MIKILVKKFTLLVAISSVVDAFDASKEVYFALYTRKNPTTEQRITANVASISKTNFNAAYPTRIYIHGASSDHTTAIPKALTAAYLKKGNFNVILVDWKCGAGEIYFNARGYVPLVADQVAKLVKFLIANNSTKLDTLLVSGHSLGAHVAGFTGKKVAGINAIVGMDAANPFYSEDKPAERLTSTDAKIVQAIHTTNTLGLNYLIGTVDFIMNGGAFQPGCWLDLSCSHERAAYFYIESINSNKFVSNGKVMGGEPLVTGLKGKYELKTNDNAPYAKG